MAAATARMMQIAFFIVLILLIFGSFTIGHIPLFTAAGIRVAGQQRQQVAVRLDFDFFNFVGLDDLNIGHGIGQRLPQVCELHSITYDQLIYVPEVVRATPAPVARNDAVGVIATDGS